MFGLNVWKDRKANEKQNNIEKYNKNESALNWNPTRIMKISIKISN